jgi:plasmid stabilization system protein ParE
MMQVIWSQKASRDYIEILGYIAADSPANAQLVAERIDKTLKLLANAQFGQPGPLPGTFKHYIPRTSCFVVYRLKSGPRLEILHLAHAARNWGQMDWQ